MSDVEDFYQSQCLAKSITLELSKTFYRLSEAIVEDVDDYEELAMWSDIATCLEKIDALDNMGWRDHIDTYKKWMEEQ